MPSWSLDVRNKDYVLDKDPVRVFISLVQKTRSNLDRLVKVVFFVLSLLDSMKKPMLIIASSRALSSWLKSINDVTYKGNKDIRATIRDTEFYSENGCIKFQVLLSSPDAIEEDMELLDHIKWELLVRDECQRSVFSTHYNSYAHG
ncbi:hypothetical protein L1987_00234 [Smallanthus sonchifolius]|uniref:Uncharacterized protein n=1 Tax=Smallanthus sonchifolius TaxID=185202 RepID=A0ACB9K1Z6_9ASTR|nr:hypothetical protein L1987_00234 [Smallanthus sonchifolius]